jgi:alpha-1,3-glucanase-like protein
MRNAMPLRTSHLSLLINHQSSLTPLHMSIHRLRFPHLRAFASLREVLLPSALSLLLLSASFQSGYAGPGATVPWITYYSGEMNTNGTRMGPGYQPFTVEAESAQRTCIKLSQTGQYVEFNAREWANGLVVRYSIPDTPTGGGFDSTISLYKNGVFVQKLAVTSKYSWLYGFYSWTNNPADGSTRNFYDEVRLLGINVAPNDTIRLEKDASDTSPYYIVTLADLEQVPPPGTIPRGNDWLNVKNPPYNATGNGVVDDSAAIDACIKDAITQHKKVFIPAGNYLVTHDITSTIPGDLGLHDVTIQGAGMWYTNLVGDPTLYTDQTRRVRVIGGGSNVHLADFAIQGKLNYRSDPEENDGLFGSYGTGSTIVRVWVEHTKVGCWPSNSNGLIIFDCRMRDLIADGYNLNVGMRHTLVTNCTARGTGDDSFAIWPTTPQITQAIPPVQVYSPGYNTIDHCTAGLNFVASGGAIYGAPGNKITNCLFEDIPVGCGILISGLFGEGTNYFSGTTTVADCDLIRTGGYDSNTPGWWAGLRLAMNSAGVTNAGLPGLTVSNVNIEDSLAYGVAIEASQPLDNAILKNVNIGNFGLAQPGFHAVWANPQAVGSMTLKNSTISETPKNESSTFQFNLENTRVSNSIPVVPTSLTATETQLQQNSAQVTLSWLPSQFATSYTIARGRSAQGPFVPIGTTTNSSFIDNVPAGVNSYYIVTASNQYGRSDESVAVTPTLSTGITLTAGTFKDDSVLRLVSSPEGVVSSVGLGANTPAERTANGYLFQGYTDSQGGGGIYSGTNTSHTIAVANYVGDRSGLVGQATTGDAAFNSVLNNVANGSTQNIVVTLSNLTVGKTYNVLFLETDAVDQEPRGYDVTSGTAQSPTLFFAFDPNQYYVGSYVLGTFTATATTQTFDVGISYTNSTYALLTTVTSQLNAVLVGTPDSSH